MTKSTVLNEPPRVFRPIYMDHVSGTKTPFPRTANTLPRFDPKSGTYTILWDDIKMAFDKALRVLNKDTIVPFLTDKNLQFLESRRISSYPSVILDVDQYFLNFYSNFFRHSRFLTSSSFIYEFITNNNFDEYPDRQDNPSNQESRQSNDAYEQGLGLYRNLEFAKALAYFLKAANEGNADTQDRTGTMCRCGSGTLQDYNKALFWYRKAANQGYVTSQINLGSMYQNGYGVTRDDHKAIFWYEKAAEQGSAIAQCNLGVMYQDGHGVASSSIKALNWYRKAALQGDAFAQYYKGEMYHYGTDSLSKHSINAERFYEQAAKQRHVDAERKLEVCSLLDSPPPDSVDSIPKTKTGTLWFRRVVKQD